MTQPLTFGFALMSPLSARPPHAVPREEMLAEVEQELADRVPFYGRMVAAGKMEAGTANRHLDVLRSIGADLGGAPAPFAFSWDAKVREMRRELALRRNAWPRRIAKPADPLTEAAAARRMERLDAVHFLYWVGLFEADDEFAGRALPPPHVLPSDGGSAGVIRAYLWRIWRWERAALAVGDPAARPWMAMFYALVDAGDSEAVEAWDHYRDCAERMGFAERERQAA